MTITVRLIGPFIQASGFSEKKFVVPKGTTINALIGLVGIDESRPKIVTRNGRAIAPSEQIQEEDRIVISPIYSGG